jgi:hypothetical protein
VVSPTTATFFLQIFLKRAAKPSGQALETLLNLLNLTWPKDSQNLLRNLGEPDRRTSAHWSYSELKKHASRIATTSKTLKKAAKEAALVLSYLHHSRSTCTPTCTYIYLSSCCSSRCSSLWFLRCSSAIHKLHNKYSINH